jgi:uncharacterized protein (TIGR00251 family)
MAERVTLRLRVIPGARRDEIAGWYGDAVKVRCQAPALDGRANESVIEFLAERLRVKRSDIELVHGERSRSKVIEVNGLASDEAYARLGIPAPVPRP